MKKIIILTLFAIATVTASAQTAGYLKSSPTHANIDTVTNTGTVTQYIDIPGYQDVVSIQVTVLEISGTTAGKVILMGANDITGTGIGGALIYDTLTYNIVTNYPTWSPADVTTAQTTIFTVDKSRYSRYAIRYTGAGTMSAKLQSYAIWRKQ